MYQILAERVVVKDMATDWVDIANSGMYYHLSILRFCQEFETTTMDFESMKYEKLHYIFQIGSNIFEDMQLNHKFDTFHM